MFSVVRCTVLFAFVLCIIWLSVVISFVGRQSNDGLFPNPQQQGMTLQRPLLGQANPVRVAPRRQTQETTTTHDDRDAVLNKGGRTMAVTRGQDNSSTFEFYCVCLHVLDVGFVHIAPVVPLCT